PTDAAGAIVDEHTLNAGLKKGLNINDFLRNNDSYNFLKRTGNLLTTGQLNTNVMDMVIILQK
ncbi:MAG: glycerate kinase, partial [Planctomycetes bacterium]|nr:glycerate kinase [Planctomycetota bacterium]